MRLKNDLTAISYHRRAQGGLHDLGQLLLFSIRAVLSGAASCRKIQRFMAPHRERVNATSLTTCGVSTE
jgi:hypothetical protein